MTRTQYKNQSKTARALARQNRQTEAERRELAAAVLRVVEAFNGKITGYTRGKDS